jgi:hypothetical protein
MESPISLQLHDPLEMEPEKEAEECIPVGEAWLSIGVDPALLLFAAVDSLASETIVKARYFRRVGNNMTMPYPPNAS